MAKYLIKILLIVLVGLYISWVYYNKFSFHQENFDGYSPYILFILINYFIYKIYTVFINYKEKLEFSPLGIFSLFSYQLLFFSFFFFSISNYSHNAGLIFFASILGKLVLPFLITIISYSFGKKIIDFIENKSEKKEESKFIFLMSLGLGFSAFIFFLTIVGTIGFYNIYSVFAILSLFGIFAYKQLFTAFKNLYNYKITIENHQINSNSFLEKLNPYLLSTEFLFIIISLLISTNFISIFRPTPIGWDDMGVYMNYPRMMAQSGDLLSLGLVAWQTLTGIGFMIKSTTQAFFLNNLGSILSVIVLVVSFSSLLKNSKKTFLNIPLFLATIFLALPMIIFQQAKDMKLDTGLFFISSIVIFGAIHIFIKYFGYKKDDNYIIEDTINKPKINNFVDNLKKYFSQNTVYGNSLLFSEKKYLFYIFILGIIAGFAFTIKVTTLLLVAGILGIFFYAKLGFSGFLGYLSIFFGIFTKFSLWDYMGKINYPKDDQEFKNMFFTISVTFGITLILYSINKYKIKAFSKLITLVGVFLAGFVLFLSPFFAKHISETISAGEKITVGSLISGKTDRFKVDYTKFLTKEKLEQIEKKAKIKEEEERKEGKTKNEDFGRYFGYEDGINNYIKMPINLTMQKYQKGEFTDISYIFLALIPIIFLFLNFKNSFATAGILGILVLESFIFFIPVGKTFFTDFFAKLEFPFGYLILLLIFLASLFFFLYGLKKDKNSQIFRLISVFLIFYLFLWSIAAFGIIWYGIAMFYGLLLMIGIALYNISAYEKTEFSKIKFIKFFGTLSVFLVVSVYFFNSTFPHSFKNIKKSGYSAYKASDFGDLELIFGYSPGRLEVLFSLNIAEDKKEKFLREIINSIGEEPILRQFEQISKDDTDFFKNPKKIEDALKSLELQISKKLFIQLVNKKPKYKTLNLNTKTIRNFKNILKDNKKDFEVLDKVTKAKKELYKGLLDPKREYKNKANIYRVGTFYKYFIVDNYKRFYGDSLITNYIKYFKTGNVEKDVENMKKFGLSYILMDLNAATIDNNDPRHDLSNRYEDLLRLTLAKNLTLISTDSICFKTARESYKKGIFDIEKFLTIAGINSESYRNGKRILRHVKKNECFNYILKLQKNKKINKNNYPYLLFLNNKNLPKEKKLLLLKQKIGQIGGSYALLKID